MSDTSKLKSLMNKYITQAGDDIFFCGRDDVPDDFDATVTFARVCSGFTIDVEDEVCFDEEHTCFNCRYRRWTCDGFSCLKGFPLL